MENPENGMNAYADELGSGLVRNLTGPVLAISLLAQAPLVLAEQDKPLWQWPLALEIERSQPFDRGLFQNPPAFYRPAYFWMWNAPLEPDLLRRQLREMAANGARSVCMLPMPREFRPGSTNNSMDPGYLTDGFFDRVGLAMEEARRLKMHWWIYDEGGWPSGQACGQVVAGHPELTRQTMVREEVKLLPNQPYVVPADAAVLVVHEGERRTLVEPGQTWRGERAPDKAWVYRIRRSGGPDLLNPKATERFIELTHQRYANLLGRLPSRPEVCFTFTDEPAVAGMAAGRHVVWTEGARDAFKARFGYDIYEHLDELFTEPGAGAKGWPGRARVDYFDFWTQRFCEAYFEPLRAAARQMGLFSGGHLGGEDETLGALAHGYGHILRTLRATDVPGVDVIWRQLFPGREPRHHFPKFASSAAHQIGRRLAFTESMAVYGNGATPEQIKWVLDYQFVRGLQLVVMGCYPLSTRDHHMTGERPHFGPVDPIWPMLSDLHAYVARVSYAMSCGEPRVDAALYYPARDMWACGFKDTSAAGDHDRLARTMLERQCEFDIVDDDILQSWPAAEGWLMGKAVRYRTLVFGRTRWLSRPAAEKLAQWLKGPGLLVAADHLPGVEGDGGEALANMIGVPNRPGRHSVGQGAGQVVIGSIQEAAASVPPILTCRPPNPEIRVIARDLPFGGAMYFVVNEGLRPYQGRLTFREGGTLERLNPQTGRSESLQTTPETPGRQILDVHLAGTESMLIQAAGTGQAPPRPQITPPITWRDVEARWALRPLRQHRVGEHDFEVCECNAPAVQLDRLGPWAPHLTADFSGHGEYRTTLTVPADWADRRLLLDLGRVEYACQVSLDGRPVGKILWQPWQIELPPMSAGPHEMSIVVANTLANELTSHRVRETWSKKKGPGWPSPYHERALRFEAESRGGGLIGPVRIGLKKG
jgi:hypothetical protein